MEFNGFTEKANEALSAALRCAMSMGHTYVGSEHILFGLSACGGGVGYLVLEHNGIKTADIAGKIQALIGKGLPTKLTPADFTPRSKRILEMSITIARSSAKPLAGTEHLLRAILRDSECYACTFLNELGANTALMYSQCTDAMKRDSILSSPKKEKKGDVKLSNNLMKYGRDLTDAAGRGLLDPCLCREAETDRIIEILLRRTKNNPCLIGEAGVGKTAVAEGLAVRIAEKKVPQAIQDKRIYMLDLTSMLAGAKYRGDFEERVKNVFDEIISDGSYIVFIDEIHNIVGAGAAEGAIDAANILKPMLARGEIHLIGATTVEEYHKYIEKESALERRFQPVMINEPDASATRAILKGLRERYEKHHSVRITDEAIDSAISLSERYINDRRQPDKSIDLIDEAASSIRLRTPFINPGDFSAEYIRKQLAAEKERAVQEKNFQLALSIREKEKELAEEMKNSNSESKYKYCASMTAEDIARIVSQQTGIPLSKIDGAQAERYIGLEEKLGEKIIGQTQAIAALARAIRIGRAGLKGSTGPLGSFIFLGPSGVGKTLCCKELAECLFGDKNALIRFDMSEYMEKHSVSKLIGSPPGYVGYGEGGMLTEKVKRRPYSVILFDEIEKANSDIFNILLQVLEDGRLTDSCGKTVDFSNTIIIMTGNIGSKQIGGYSSTIGFGGSDKNRNDEKAVLAELKNFFRPEFLSRIDETIIFNSLGRDDLKRICILQMDRLARNCKEQSVGLSWTEAYIDRICSLAEEADCAARALRKIIARNTEDDISLKIIKGELSKGDSIIADYNTENGFFIKGESERIKSI